MTKWKGIQLADELYHQLSDDIGIAVVISYGTEETRQSLFDKKDENSWKWERVHICEVGDWRKHRAFVLMKGKMYRKNFIIKYSH